MVPSFNHLVLESTEVFVTIFSAILMQNKRYYQSESPNHRHDRYSSRGLHSDNPPSKDVRTPTWIGIGKRRATQLKPEKIRIDELSSQLEKLYTEALLEVLNKAIAEEINADLENDCMVCYEPAMQIHSRCLSDPRESVDHNFDNALR